MRARGVATLTLVVLHGLATPARLDWCHSHARELGQVVLAAVARAVNAATSSIIARPPDCEPSAARLGQCHSHLGCTVAVALHAVHLPRSPRGSSSSLHSR